ncbi:MAG: hypothetical protein U1F43_31075 [Myxococcota bacterium]
METHASEEAMAEALAEARDAEATLDHAAALAGYRALRARVGPTALGRQAARHEADLLLKLGRNDEATAAFDALIADCEAAPTGEAAEALAGALAERAHAAYRSGDGPGIRRYAERALSVARQLGTPSVVAHALRFLGIAHEFAGRHAEAEATHLALLETAPDARHVGPVCNSLGEIARAAGRFFGTAVSWYRRFLDERRTSHGDEPNIVYLNNMGAALVELRARGGTAAARAPSPSSGALATWPCCRRPTTIVRWHGSARVDSEGRPRATRSRATCSRRFPRRGRDAGDPAALAGAHPPAEGWGAAGQDIAPDASPVELLHRSIAILGAAAKPAEAGAEPLALGEVSLADGAVAGAIDELEAVRTRRSSRSASALGRAGGACARGGRDR